MKKGFTLIELLIVITIIGILAVAFLPSLLGAPSKARDTQRIADLQKISGVLTNLTISGNLPAVSGCIGGSGTQISPDLNPADFGGNDPEDPQDSNTAYNCAGGYQYVVGVPGTDDYAFGLFANLENANQGNFASCSGSTLPSLTSTGAPLITGGECFAVLIQ